MGAQRRIGQIDPTIGLEGPMASKVIAITLGILMAVALLVGTTLYITSTRYASREAKVAAEQAERARAVAQSDARKATARRGAAWCAPG